MLRERYVTCRTRTPVIHHPPMITAFDFNMERQESLQERSWTLLQRGSGAWGSPKRSRVSLPFCVYATFVHIYVYLYLQVRFFHRYFYILFICMSICMYE